MNETPQPRLSGLRSLARRRSPLDIDRIPAHQAHLLGWVARIISWLMVLVFWALLLRFGAPFVEDAGTWQSQAQFALLAAATIGAALAWRWAITGATVMILSGAGLGVLATLSYSPSIAFLPFAAFLIPSVLYWLVWQRTQPALAIAILAVFVGGIATIGAYAATEVHETFFGPTHPASSASQVNADAVEWAWAGGTTGRGTVVTAKLREQSGDVRLAVSENESLASAAFVEPAAITETGVARFEVTDLQPDRTYYYALEVDGELDQVRTGQVRTFPEGAASFSFAFGGCARTGSNGQVFDTIRELDPLFFLFGGDFHYDDIEEDDPAAFASAYQSVLTSPAQSRLYRSTSTAYVWDDHDFGGNNSDRTSPAREAAFAAYDGFVPHYPLAESGEPAIYQAFTVGRIRFVLTDLRSARDPAIEPDGPGKSMMGEEQKTWFKQELLAASEEFPVIVWLSSVPWISAEQSGADDWGGYADERREIASFIAEHEIDGLLMLGGDAHMLAIDDGSNSDYAPGGGAAFPVFHAAALDRYGTTKGGPYSEGAYPGGGQFGFIQVEDDGGSEITITLSGRNWDGDEVVGHRFTVQVAPGE